MSNEMMLSERFPGLIEPEEQPWATRFITMPFECLPTLRVAIAVLVRCLRGETYSVASLVEDLDMSYAGADGFLLIARECGCDTDGMHLWSRDKHFLPCRDNAAKALIRSPLGLRDDLVAEFIGFDTNRDLIDAVNGLPSGTDLIRDLCSGKRNLPEKGDQRC